MHRQHQIVEVRLARPPRVATIIDAEGPVGVGPLQPDLRWDALRIARLPHALGELERELRAGIEGLVAIDVELRADRFRAASVKTASVIGEVMSSSFPVKPKSELVRVKTRVDLSVMSSVQSMSSVPLAQRPPA